MLGVNFSLFVNLFDIAIWSHRHNMMTLLLTHEAKTKWTKFCRHFQIIFFNENVWIWIKISLKFVPKGPINNIPALVQIMAWRWPGDTPLSEPMTESLGLNELNIYVKLSTADKKWSAEPIPPLQYMYCQLIDPCWHHVWAVWYKTKFGSQNLAIKFGVFLVIHMYMQCFFFKKHVQCGSNNDVIKYCGWGIHHSWDMSFWKLEVYQLW